LWAHDAKVSLTIAPVAATQTGKGKTIKDNI